MPAVSLVVISYEMTRELPRTLLSLSPSHQGLDGCDYEIILVDNASTDDSLSWARSLATNALAPLRIIANAVNVGFAKANNQAFAQSRSAAILLLNPDAEVTAGAIDRLLTTVCDDPRTAACAPRLLNPDGSLQPSVWANPLTPLHIMVSALGLWRILPRGLRGRLLFGDHWLHDSLREVPVAFGAALMVKRSIIDEVGGLDERFEMFSEDSEWCLRVRRAGGIILFDPRAIVTHHGGSFAVARWGHLGTVRVKTESYLLLQRITLSPLHRVANVVTLILVTIVRLLQQRLRGGRAEEARMRLKLYTADLARGFRFRP